MAPVYGTVVDGTRYEPVQAFLERRQKIIPHECRQRHLLEWNVSGIIITAMNSGRGDMAVFSVGVLRLALVAIVYPHQPRP